MLAFTTDVIVFVASTVAAIRAFTWIVTEETGKAYATERVSEHVRADGNSKIVCDRSTTRRLRRPNDERTKKTYSKMKTTTQRKKKATKIGT